MANVPFCELIQNAMDAVDLREQKFSESDYVKRLLIKVDLRENSIYIAYNGIGFNETQFKAFLSPNIAFKTAQKLRGNKGVGATYLGYGFNYLEMYTLTSDFTCCAIFKDARCWIENTTNEPPPPEAEEVDRLSPFDFDRGSTF